ncbi:MAG: imidazole glycerol phosphate synthase subunit HisH [Holosporales bacterium]|jgi:glutamine amidotransferase|nr:imidazole glycerol phosphate synthase subunit HisH [Holosporales bacterium]
MSIKVIVVDYGLGNMLSVCRALEYCGAETSLAVTSKDVASADRLVLPGVGAFAAGIERLANQDLIDALQKFAKSGRPLLGICLGMQLFMSIGEEFGEHNGLDIISGKVKSLPPVNDAGDAVKIPHIGWGAVINAQNDDLWENSVLKGVKPGEFVYFVHSFVVDTNDKHLCIAQCVHDGIRIPAVIKSGNVYGCQFHPEKSGPVGMRIIKNFLAL